MTDAPKAPLTPEEAEREVASAPDMPLTREQIDRIVDYATKPQKAPPPELVEWCRGWAISLHHGDDTVEDFAAAVQSKLDEQRVQLEAEIDGMAEDYQQMCREHGDCDAKFAALSAKVAPLVEALRATLIEGPPLVECADCGHRKAPVGRSAPLEAIYCADECPGHRQAPHASGLWPGETLAEFGYPREAAERDAASRAALAAWEEQNHG